MTNLLIAAVIVASLPNPALTPGAVRPLSKDQICQTVWHLDHRAVTTDMKKQVAAAYSVPWAALGKFEVDHLVPRNLGGKDDVRNLWVMCCIVKGRIVGVAHQKDVLENRLNRLVCSGHLSLAQARTEIVADWPAAYRRYVVAR